MMTFKKFFLIMAAAFTMTEISQAETIKEEASIKATATWTYATKDGEELKMDYYAPAKGSEIDYQGKRKPTIVFLFGGGFRSGERSEPCYLGYFDAITRMGYPLATIDYRLGMKGKKGGTGLRYFNLFREVITMAAEDLCSAVSFLIANRDLTGIDADNLVLCGSSAGAITVLQTAWMHNLKTSGLPENFSFKGVMSYSGAVISNIGQPVFSSSCPMLLLHGTADKVVEYKKIQFFKIGFFGSDSLAKFLSGSGTPYFFLRYESYGHEISSIMEKTVDVQDDFIKRNVLKKEGVTMDALVIDNNIERWKPIKTADLYD